MEYTRRNQKTNQIEASKKETRVDKLLQKPRKCNSHQTSIKFKTVAHDCTIAGIKYNWNVLQQRIDSTPSSSLGDKSIIVLSNPIACV